MKWFTCYFHTIYSRRFVGSRENGCHELLIVSYFEYSFKCIICVYATCLYVKIVLQIYYSSAILHNRLITNTYSKFKDDTKAYSQ